MDTFLGLYFHFCLEPALETSAKASLAQSLRVQALTSMVRALWPASAPADWKLSTDSEMVWGIPTRGEEWFLSPFVLSRREMVQPLPTKALL